MYQIDRLDFSEIEAASITTRLMVAPHYRSSTVTVRIVKSVYRFALEHGITTDLIDCNAHLVPFFTRLGYELHRTDLVHPEYGAVTVMKLQCHNHRHLAEVRSPFYDVLVDWRMSAEASAAIAPADRFD
jgi:GNAT superfamily N-acetyltransferase